MKKTIEKAVAGFSLILLTICIASFAAAESEVLTDGSWSYTLDENNLATIVYYSGEDESLEFPAFVGGHPVVTIGDGTKAVVFSRNTSAIAVTGPQYITLPSGVRTISAKAFNGQAIRSVFIPDTVLSIGDSAFRNTWLTDISVPGSVISVGSYAFASNAKAEQISLNSGLESIGAYAFSSCGTTAFYESSSNKMPGIILPDTVRTIGDGAFASPLQSFTFSEGLTSVGKKIFGSQSNMLGGVTLPSDWTEIPESLFESFNSNITITIPSGITKIGKNAFASITASALKVILPDTLEELGERAFYLSSKLFSGTLELPASLREIGDWALYNCGASYINLPDNLTSLGTSFTNVPLRVRLSSATGSLMVGLNGYTIIDLDSGNFQVRFTGGNAIIERYLGSGTEVSIPATLSGCPVTTIGQYSTTKRVKDEDGDWVDVNVYTGAFEGATGVEQVSLPTSITAIADSAFKGCTALTAIDLPSGLKSIGKEAFKGCSSLTTAVIPEGLETMGASAFSGCVSLASFHVPSSWTEIPERYFAGMSGLTEVTLPSGVTSIGNYAFVNCSGLASLQIPSGVTVIGEGVFSGCGSLASVSLPSGLQSIGAKAFINCSSLAAAAIPSDVTVIGNEAYKNCEMLGSVTFASGTAGAMEIGDSAFEGCVSLAEINFRNRVKAIGAKAFYGCSSLASFTGTNNLRTAGDSALEGCTALTELVAPQNINSLGKNVFPAGCLLYLPTDSYLDNCLTDTAGLRILKYYTNGTSYWKITQFIGEMDELTIPSLIVPTSTKKVNAIDSNAFSNATVRKVILPEGVTQIKASAFSGSAVEEVVLPSTLTSLGVSAFANSQIRTLSIPSGITALPEKLFYECTSLTDVALPETLTGIGDKAFYHNTALTELNIPESVTDIGYQAFGLTSDLLTVRLPENLSFSKVSASDMSSLFGGVFVVSAGSTTGAQLLTDRIPFAAPENPDWLIRGSTDGVSIVDYRGEAMKTLTVPDEIASFSVVHLELTTTHPEITDLILPPELHTLSLTGCTNLRIVVLPDHMTSVSDGCGPAGCVFCYRTGTQTATQMQYAPPLSIGYTLADGKVTIDSFSQPSAGDFTIPSEIDGVPVTAIGSKAFVYPYSHLTPTLTGLVIPSSVETIGEFAFKGNTSLTELTLSEGLKTLATGAFQNCPGLTDVTLPDSLTAIGDQAFYCESGTACLQSLTLPDHMTSVGCRLMGIGTDLTGKLYVRTGTVTMNHLPLGTQFYDAECPGACYSRQGTDQLRLESLDKEDPEFKISRYVTEIAEAVLRQLKVLRLPAQTKQIEEEAFAGLTCDAIFLPDGCTSIGPRAFADCPNLFYVRIPDSVTDIAPDAFDGCPHI